MRKFYPLADNLSAAERVRFGIKGVWNSREIKAVNAFEYRCPRKGEWYLSGAIPEAYRAPNDLSQAFDIVKLVRTKTITETVITEDKP